MSSLERSSGRRVAFCSLRTKRSAAQTDLVPVRRARASKFVLYSAARKARGRGGRCGLAGGTPPPLPPRPPLPLSHRNAARVRGRSRQQGGAGQGAAAAPPAGELTDGGGRRAEPAKKLLLPEPFKPTTLLCMGFSGPHTVFSRYDLKPWMRTSLMNMLLAARCALGGARTRGSHDA